MGTKRLCHLYERSHLLEENLICVVHDYFPDYCIFSSFAVLSLEIHICNTNSNGRSIICIQNRCHSHSHHARTPDIHQLPLPPYTAGVDAILTVATLIVIFTDLDILYCI